MNGLTVVVTTEEDKDIDEDGKFEDATERRGPEDERFDGFGRRKLFGYNSNNPHSSNFLPKHHGCCLALATEIRSDGLMCKRDTTRDAARGEMQGGKNQAGRAGASFI